MSDPEYTYVPPYVPLTRKEVEKLTGLSRSAIYAKMRQNPNRPQDYDPSFPRPLRFSSHTVMWRSDEIDRWLLTRERAHVVE